MDEEQLAFVRESRAQLHRSVTIGRWRYLLCLFVNGFVALGNLILGQWYFAAIPTLVMMWMVYDRHRHITVMYKTDLLYQQAIERLESEY